jgi:hypothetical protein
MEGPFPRNYEDFGRSLLNEAQFVLCFVLQQDER